jgi:hypothetical protein
MTSKLTPSTPITTNSDTPISSPTPPSQKTVSSTSNKSQLGEDQPQGKSPSISLPVEPIVIKKTQEPLTPVVLKTPHQNPEPVQKPENIQRRNVPRFVIH